MITRHASSTHPSPVESDAARTGRGAIGGIAPRAPDEPAEADDEPAEADELPPEPIVGAGGSGSCVRHYITYTTKRMIN